MISDLEKLKKKMIEKPWLYEEEEHAVLKLAEEAIQFIKDSRNRGDTSAMFSLFVSVPALIMIILHQLYK